MAHETNTSKCSGEENCPLSEEGHSEWKQSGLRLRGMVNPECWEDRLVKQLVIMGCPWWIYDMLVESESIFQIWKVILVFFAIYAVKLQFGFYFKYYLFIMMTVNMYTFLPSEIPKSFYRLYIRSLCWLCWYECLRTGNLEPMRICSYSTCCTPSPKPCLQVQYERLLFS